MAAPIISNIISKTTDFSYFIIFLYHINVRRMRKMFGIFNI